MGPYGAIRAHNAPIDKADTITLERRSSRNPTWIDAYIGRRIQQRRIELGMSLHQLAEKVGLSIQQIQKFETGTNRLPASRLADIATALKASPGDFFPATGEDAPGPLRGDLIRAQKAIDDLIARHKESIEDLPPATLPRAADVAGADRWNIARIFGAFAT